MIIIRYGSVDQDTVGSVFTGGRSSYFNVNRCETKRQVDGNTGAGWHDGVVYGNHHAVVCGWGQKNSIFVFVRSQTVRSSSPGKAWRETSI